MAYKDPSGNWFEGLFDTWDYRDTGNPASDALANTTTAIVNTPASLLNAGLEGLRQIGELVAPHEPTITNFTVSTPVPHDDVLAAGVKVVAAASKLPAGRLGGTVIKFETAAQRLAHNKTMGKAAEAQAKIDLEAVGNTVLGSQVSMQTSQGRRVIDHLIRTPDGCLVACEIKYGNAMRNPSQIAKDNVIANEGGIFVGKNAPVDLTGTRWSIETIEIRYGEFK